MYAIETKYLGPTNTKGTRVGVRWAGSRMYVAWDYALNSEENHIVAARAILTRESKAHPEQWASGYVGAGRYVHVYAPGHIDGRGVR